MQHGDTILGRFELRERLGPHGARTQTWRVAQGVLKLARVGSQEGDDRRQEAVLLAAVPEGQARAAQIAPLLEHGEDEGWCWLLLEDVGALDLSRHWAREGVSFADVLDVGQAIAGALVCLHTHGVLHRDVKEANIVVAPGRGPERYWLVDLGIGRRLDHRPAVTMDLRGSHDRVPPEAVTAGRKVGPPGDVFVLCKLLAQGLVGSPNVPWPDDVDAQIEACGLDATDPRHLALVRLLARGMRLEPERRPSAAELAQRFADIRAGKVGTPRPRWWLPLATFVAGGAAVGAVLLWPKAEAPPTIAFEDKSVEWGLAVAAPDATPMEAGGEPSSGFMGSPALADLDQDGDWELLVPRCARPWQSTTTSLKRDLLLEPDPAGSRWTVLEDEPGAREQAWIAGDLDGDGAIERIGYHYDESWTIGVRVVPGKPGSNTGTRLSGAPLLVPTRSGTGLVGGPNPWLAERERQAWLDRWSADKVPLHTVTWLDLGGDGELALVAVDDGKAVLYRWQDETWSGELLGDFRVVRIGHTRHDLFAVGDLDADGDEDLVVGNHDDATLVLFEHAEDQLLRVHGVSLPLHDEDETDGVRDGHAAIQAMDLDGDGLPEIVLPTGGFADKGAPRTKIWRNLGAWRFERVALPTELSAPHHGLRLFPLDVDDDGRLDLLQPSGNDRLYEVPTHRAFHAVGASDHRLWPLRLRLPGDVSLPLGTRVLATEPRPWLHVVRNSWPLMAPDWLRGDLLVELPDGRILVAPLGEGLQGATTIQLDQPELPPLLGPWREPLQPGEPMSSEPGLQFRAQGESWELELWTANRPTELVLRNEGEETRTQPLTISSEGLGCDPRGSCWMLENLGGGGYRLTRLDPRSGEMQPIEGSAGMVVGAVRAHDHVFTASGAALWEHDPQTLARQPVEHVAQPRLACTGLGFDGRHLACCSEDPPRVALYDPETYTAVAEHALPTELGCDVLPVPGGWLTSTADGVAWFEGQGRPRRLHLGDAPLLVPADGGLWAILDHRALWLDVEHRRIIGGMTVPNAGVALPVPPLGQLGHQ